MTDKETKNFRPICVIAKEIKENWKNVYFGAEPYLQAMFSLQTIDDYYYQDSADEIIRYFLANAMTWRGEVARRIKKELNSMIGG